MPSVPRNRPCTTRLRGCGPWPSMSAGPRIRPCTSRRRSPRRGGRLGRARSRAGTTRARDGTGVHVRRRTRAAAPVLAALLLLAACGGEGRSAGPAAPIGPPQRGGEITVLEDAAFAGGWPTGLDPATNTTGGANIAQMSAIYGGLFRLEAADDGSGAEVVPHQAESYELLDGGTTVRITIREGIRFTDGTPMDAEAVAFNFRRAVDSPCTCSPTWPLAENGITTDGPRTVVLKFTRPFAAVINAFPATNVNWIASPTALQQMGEEQ